MADLTITAASVIPAASNTTVSYNETAGETITAGQAVYRDSGDNNECKKCDTTSAAKAAAYGIALNGASDGQPLAVLRSGNINPGATVAVGEVYTVSDTAGGIAVAADNGSGDYVTVLGIGTTTSNIAIDIQATGVAHA